VAVAASAVAALAVAVIFLAGLAAKERDDRFCVACHLHEEKFARLTAAAPTDLAGFHHARDLSVGCIACHGGADLPMRLRVWTVAGFDTVRFLTGLYREPTHMRLPLRDAECRSCHTPILEPATPGLPSPAAPASPPHGPQDDAAAAYGTRPEDEARGQTSFHAIVDHATVNVRCVRCHTAHTTDSEPRRRFLSAPAVSPVCKECHPAM
jgi:hypothetical protein